MDSNSKQGYKPPPEFQVEAKEPLIDLSSTDSTELWLIQWPKNKELPGLDGQELSLNLHRDGQLGSFEDSSGKNYDIVSFAAQESNATVFLSSASKPNIDEVSSQASFGSCLASFCLTAYLQAFMHSHDTIIYVGSWEDFTASFPCPLSEPDEIQKQNSNNLRQIYEKSRGSSLINSSRQFSIQSSILRNSQTTSSRPTSTHSGRPASTHSSRQRSSLSEVGEPSKPPKRKHVRESTGSMEHSAQDSGRGHSVVTSSGSVERSHKSKKRS
uniref:Mediator-associated protein 2 n=1 Tax=Fagus sylvatica TaxID=28930 RepID=A0A2N9EXH2_FAGSY